MKKKATKRPVKTKRAVKAKWKLTPEEIVRGMPLGEVMDACTPHGHGSRSC